MWEHAATQDNVAALRRRGTIVLDPAEGRLTGADSGKGRLPEPAEIFELAQRVLARSAAGRSVGEPADLSGRRVVVSAGGTREPLDPVRFLGNRSSGRQGYALAATAAARGAEVVLVAANVELADPAGVKVVPVETAEQLRVAMLEQSVGADAVVMAAAVADHRPARVAEHKIKKAEPDATGTAPTADAVELVRNPDVLRELVAARGPGQVVVGFAAETGDAEASVLDHGRRKLAAKGCDLLVVNDVGPGGAFGSAENAAVVLAADGAEVDVARGPKTTLADTVWDLVRARLT